jgi:hypothetical protein
MHGTYQLLPEFALRFEKGYLVSKTYILSGTKV